MLASKLAVDLPPAGALPPSTGFAAAALIAAAGAERAEGAATAFGCRSPRTGRLLRDEYVSSGPGGFNSSKLSICRDLVADLDADLVTDFGAGPSVDFGVGLTLRGSS